MTFWVIAAVGSGRPLAYLPVYMATTTAPGKGGQESYAK